MFLPIGVKATGVETKGKECGSGLSSCWWGEGALRDEPKQRLQRRLGWNWTAFKDVLFILEIFLFAQTKRVLPFTSLPKFPDFFG